MATSLAFLFFGTLAAAGVVGMLRIQSAQNLEASEIERKRKARLAEFRAKCFRPDGD